MSDNMSLQVDFVPLVDAVRSRAESVSGWQISSVHARVFRAQPDDDAQPTVAIKTYSSADAAEREFAVLMALRDFGINLGPEPLALDTDGAPLVIMGWLDANPLDAPPVPEDETMWHRFMAAMGASGSLNLIEYSSQIPMQGKGMQNPRDMIDQVESMAEEIEGDSETVERLSGLTECIRGQIAPEWNNPVRIGLCRRNYAPEDFLWDGHHLLAVDWEEADWGDMAAETGILSAHPAYEALPPSHWVWFRWEFARLTHDDDLVPRATIYARLAQVWWAAKLSLGGDTQRRDRYLDRAEKLFR